MLKSLKSKVFASRNIDNQKDFTSDQKVCLSEESSRPTEEKKQNSFKRGTNHAIASLKRLQTSMGNFASSIIQRHHSLDARDDYAERLMTSLNKMRDAGIGCEVTFEGSKCPPCHVVVASYSPALFELCTYVASEKVNENEKESTEAQINSDIKDEEKTQDDEKTEICDSQEEDKDDSKDDKSLSEDKQVTALEVDNEAANIEDNQMEMCENQEDLNVENTKNEEDENVENTKNEEDENVENTINEEDENVENEKEDREVNDEEVTVDIENNVAEGVEKEDVDKTKLDLEEAESIKEIDKESYVEEDNHCEENPGFESDNLEVKQANEEDIAIIIESEDETEEKISFVLETEEKIKDDSDIKPEALTSFINFLYTARIRINKENVVEIRQLSDKCGLVELAEACDRFIVLSENEQEKESAGEAFVYEDPTMFGKMLTHFNQLRHDQKYLDISIPVNDKTSIKAHRVILAAASIYFQEKVFKDDAVDISSFHDGSFSKCINFFYSGTAKVSTGSVEHLILVSRLLGATELTIGCGEVLESTLTNDNCLKLRQLAIDNESESLLTAANNWISQHIAEVTKLSSFKHLDLNSVISILKTDNLNLDCPLSNGEMVVFTAAAHWLEHDFENRKSHTKQIFSTVRFPLISMNNLLNHVTTHKAVLEDEVTTTLVADVLTNKKSKLLSEAVMRGSECIVTTGGSAIVEDLTSENQDYTPVGYYPKVTLYDRETNRYYDWTSLPESRSSHCALTCGQYLFILGGYDPYSCISNEVYYLDVATGKWNKGPTMKIKRAFFTAHAIDEWIFVVGGLVPKGYSTSVEKLNRRTMKWEKACSLPITRYRHAGCVMEDEIFISGGYEKSRSFYSFNHKANIGWKEQSSMNIGRDSHVMAATSNAIICAGGEGIEFSTERFSNGIWEVLTTSQITKQLYYPSYIVHKDTVILFGGWEGENEPTDCVWSYNVSDDKWVKESHILPIALGSASSCVVKLPESYWKIRFSNKS